MRLITLLITVVALAVAAPAIADKGGTPNGGNGGGGGGGGETPTATPTPTPDTTASSPTTSSNGKKGGANNSTADPSISIATVNGVAAASILSPSPRHGDVVTFASDAGSLAGWEHAMVVVSCYQDLNGNASIDTTLTGPEKVWAQLDMPDTAFAVGGGSSSWTQGSAKCRSDLYAYGWNGGQQSIRFLASTAEWTATW